MVSLAHPQLALVVDGEPDGPSRQVAHDNGAEAAIEATDALVAPDDACRAYEAVV